MVAGPFVPAGADSSVGGVSRAALPDILKQLHSDIERDWSDHKFAVLSEWGRQRRGRGRARANGGAG